MQSDQDPELSRLLKEHVTRHKAPDLLRRRIVDSLEQQRRSSWRGRLGVLTTYLGSHWQALTAAAASGVVATLVGTHLSLLASQDELLFQQVVSSHIRASVSSHQIDVASSDRHTVKPWFAGKLDYSPQVHDYAADGFELVGGRLDFLNDRFVAALVYKRRLHTIDVYSWPTKDANTSLAQRSRQGINIVEWNDSGMRYCLASDIEFSELADLARLMQLRHAANSSKRMS